MLSGERQAMGSHELVYWHAYLKIRDEQELEKLAAFGIGGL